MIVSFFDINSMLTGIFLFLVGVLVGYILKLVMTNYERMKARRE